jgi:hypothetical protein
LYEQLAAAGHHVRALIADVRRDPRSAVRTLVCSPREPDADLPYELPLLTAPRSSPRSFLALAGTRLAAYRDMFRAAFDTELETFDPEIVHVQHLWIDGHLALESGAPYVATAYGEELDAAGADEALLRFVRETAENAGRIFTDEFRLQHILRERFEVPEERLSPADVPLERLISIYRAVSDARFGRA